MRKTIDLIFSLLVAMLVLSACGKATTQAAVSSATPNAAAAAEAMVATIAAQTMQALPSPTPQPTPTEVPFYVTATIWAEEPRIPIVNFHQFAPDTSKKSTDHKVRLEDFWKYMNRLNQAGFTLISVEDWINGDFYVPAGRRPLVFTMDDLFYNNQIRLDENGAPLPDTGLGVAWNFGQEYPEFGFQWALFSNLGDKLYAEPTNPDKDWQDELGNAIAWCLDHDARVYN
ncbi:MAG: hypothetical protein L3J16_03290, partial [Anaerolineales bacterium]|nr:hypothetical protein [Anaerolineales bacterium]